MFIYAVIWALMLETCVAAVFLTCGRAKHTGICAIGLTIHKECLKGVNVVHGLIEIDSDA